MERKSNIPNTIDDDTIMWYGAHKGKRMEDVPAAYLLWIYENTNPISQLKEYIEDNMEILERDRYKKNY